MATALPCKKRSDQIRRGTGGEDAMDGITEGIAEARTTSIGIAPPEVVRNRITAAIKCAQQIIAPAASARITVLYSVSLPV